MPLSTAYRLSAGIVLPCFFNDLGIFARLAPYLLHKSVKDKFAVGSDAKDPNTEVAKQILSYFLRHPDAADSLTEIARWRLMQESVRHSVEKTSEALKWLIDEGYMKQEVRRGTPQIFQLNTDRRADAEKFLSEGPEPGGEGSRSGRKRDDQS